ncbi:MAG: 50S ribosomal protein L3 [Candidatus Falkowbacteria bacterium]|nr:50S ribosomal protein L3 [Candidatus Falkowbacteria bacterium]
MKFIIGKKVAMTQLWQGDNVIPVTEVTAGPCTVIQLKTVEKDGYRAVQIGYGSKRSSLITKALKGHFKGFGDFRYVREFRLDNDENIGELKAGDQISLATFAKDDVLTATGTSKGKGFQGVVKRHGFHGQDATHGNKDQLRASGSVGAGGVQHVFKGVRMAGRMGGDRVTLHDVKIVAIDETNNSFFVKGALPGARNGLVLFFGEGELKTGLPVAKVEEPVVEEVTEAPVVVATEETPEEVKTEVVAEPVVVAEEKVETTPEAEVAEVKETPVVEETVAEVPATETPVEVAEEKVDEEVKTQA